MPFSIPVRLFPMDYNTLMEVNVCGSGGDARLARLRCALPLLDPLKRVDDVSCHVKTYFRVIQCRPLIVTRSSKIRCNHVPSKISSPPVNICFLKHFTTPSLDENIEEIFSVKGGGDNTFSFFFFF